MSRDVAPLAGAWIEIPNLFSWSSGSGVAPLSGAWIEIVVSAAALAFPRSSHPSRVRGLKFLIAPISCGWRLVAPLAGAWIEMKKQTRQ